MTPNRGAIDAGECLRQSPAASIQQLPSIRNETLPSPAPAPITPQPGPRTERSGDGARFLRTWLGNPGLLGAVAPSGPVLAAAMARAVDPTRPGPIIELGPGTGVVTEALLERGIARNRLVLVEYEPSFCALLSQRFPGIRVVQGDAYSLKATLGPVLEAQPSAVVSSLPLLMKPEPMRLALLAEAFDLMAPGSPFIQFTYGSASPMPRKAAFAFEAKGSARIWRNVPPARVWVYRRYDLAVQKEAVQSP